MNIYAQDPANLAGLAAIVLLAWAGLYRIAERGMAWRRAFVVANALLVVVAAYGVLRYTVLGRMPTDEHVFVLSMDPSHGEFTRELFMNGLLYFPLGLTLTAVIGPWSVLIGLVLSMGVELWQYVAGTGLAQATDVACNVLGCAVGVVPWVWARLGSWRKGRA